MHSPASSQSGGSNRQHSEFSLWRGNPTAIVMRPLSAGHVTYHGSCVIAWFPPTLVRQIGLQRLVGDVCLRHLYNPTPASDWPVDVLVSRARESVNLSLNIKFATRIIHSGVHRRLRSRRLQKKGRPQPPQKVVTLLVQQKREEPLIWSGVQPSTNRLSPFTLSWVSITPSALMSTQLT